MCQPLMQAFSEVADSIRRAPQISLFLDFDGTLSWLAASPDEAHLDQPAREALTRISRIERIVTTVISGRAIEDLYSRIRLDGLIYAGNHGLEIFGRQFRFVEPRAATFREAAAQLARHLAEELQSIPGAFVEYKAYTASVHYRQISDADLPKVESAVRSTVAPARAQFRVNSGKKVFEVVPRTGWHKGMAVQLINSTLSSRGELLSVYLGDDTTDEDAFGVLPDAITVKVGDPAATRAKYQLPDPDAVREFLVWLAGVSPVP